METGSSLAWSVQLALDIPMPVFVKEQVKDLASRLLERNSDLVRAANMHVRLKHDGPQIGCSINLVTSKKAYHSRTSGWDVRSAVSAALAHLETQLHKESERRAYA